MRKAPIGRPSTTASMRAEVARGRTKATNQAGGSGREVLIGVSGPPDGLVGDAHVAQPVEACRQRGEPLVEIRRRLQAAHGFAQDFASQQSGVGDFGIDALAGAAQRQRHVERQQQRQHGGQREAQAPAQRQTDHRRAIKTAQPGEGKPGPRRGDRICVC